MRIPYELPRNWIGQRVFIIGGGPSVKDVIGSNIGDKLYSAGKIIVVNDAFLMWQKADILYFGDGDWFEDNKEDICKFNGHEILTRVHIPERWHEYHYKTIPFNRLARDMSTGLSRHPGAVAGWCSGSNAINIAYLKGATEIVLIGFDMKGDNWHNRHKREKKIDCYNVDFIPHIVRMAKHLNSEVRVINTCMDSALDCFEKQPLDKVLT